jgi:phosphoribosylaminoimidazole-succinocarboxamide synthase
MTADTNDKAVSQTDLTELQLVHRGKVRDIYDVGENQLLLVATDRLSAFDCVLPTAIENKGRVLTSLSLFWFEKLQNLCRHHVITGELDEMPARVRQYGELRARSILVRKTRVFPVECVVRGYLAGSGWKDYLISGTVCGKTLPAGLREAEQLPAPIFTPSTKAARGHDENISLDEFARIVGHDAAEQLESLSLQLYNEAGKFAKERGIIIADTKFEFGLDEEGNILWIDEALTPDSSRFWSAENYRTGVSPPSFDKQFVRDYLETLDWNKQPPAPPLPSDIAMATSARYMEACKILTGKGLP